MTKIAVVIDTWYPFIGGGQIHTWEISRRLARNGIFIDIITRDCGQDKLKYPKNMRVIKIGKRKIKDNPFSQMIFVIKSAIFLVTHPYELIHAHGLYPGLIAKAIMIAKKTRTILSVHGTAISTGFHNPLKLFFEKLILTRFKYTCQITVSRDFLKLQNVNKKVYYIPNAVDFGLFKKIKSEKFKDPTLIFVGRLHRQKNINSLLGAMAILKYEIPSIALIVIGDGPQRKGLKDRSISLKLAGNIRFLGEITGSKLIKFYKSSHLFVLPSIYEGQPLTLLEAWAAKLPVVTSNTGDCRFLVEEAVNGYLIQDPLNHLEIANKIKLALYNKNIARLGENGYALVKKQFSWEKSAKKTLNIYQKLISE